MPDSLLSFHRWILAGRRELVGQQESSLKELTREMSCLMLYNTKTEHQAAYKSKDEDRSHFQSRNENESVVGMSLAVRKCGRKSSIVDMLHKRRLAISNGRCLLYATAIANAVIKRMQENQGMFIPSNCMKESDPAKFILDVNIPKSQTLNLNNFGELLPRHKPSKNQFQRQTACSNYVINQDNTISQACYEESMLPWIVARSVGSKLAEREQGGSKTEESTSFGIEVEDSDKNDQGKSADAHSLIEGNAEISVEENDGSINMIVRSESEKTTLASDVPSWSGYNSLLCSSLSNQIKRTNTLLLPLIPGPAAYYSAIYTALKQAQNITTWCLGEGQKTVISLDLDLYARALQLCEGHRKLRGKYIFTLGELHVVIALLRAIRHFIGNSGTMICGSKLKYLVQTTSNQY
eukprot:gene4104-4661_t